MVDGPLSAVTDEILLFTLGNVPCWGVEKRIEGEWLRQSWRVDETSTRQTRHFDPEELSLATIHLRWGPGTYRLVQSRGPSKPHKGIGASFIVGDHHAPQAAPQVAPPPALPSNGNGHPNGNGHARAGVVAPQQRALPTGLGRPPLFATAASDWVTTRDSSPMEVFMAMFAMLKDLAAEHREHEDRRSREFMRMMDLREKSIEMDARVRIADSSARSLADQEHAEVLRAELDRMRETLTAAQGAAANGKSAELQELLGQLAVTLEQMASDDDDDDEAAGMSPQTAAVLQAFAERFGAPIANAIANRIAGGAEPNQIADAIDAAIDD